MLDYEFWQIEIEQEWLHTTQYLRSFKYLIGQNQFLLSIVSLCQHSLTFEFLKIELTVKSA